MLSAGAGRVRYVQRSGDAVRVLGGRAGGLERAAAGKSVSAEGTEGDPAPHARQVTGNNDFCKNRSRSTPPPQVTLDSIHLFIYLFLSSVCLQQTQMFLSGNRKFALAAPRR